MVLVGALAVVGKAILQESALAYLGLSDPIAKSWGLMINRASRFAGIYFTDYWKWWLAAPVAAMMLTILIIRLFSAMATLVENLPWMFRDYIVPFLNGIFTDLEAWILRLDPQQLRQLIEHGGGSLDVAGGSQADGYIIFPFRGEGKLGIER